MDYIISFLASTVPSILHNFLLKTVNSNFDHLKRKKLLLKMMLVICSRTFYVYNDFILHVLVSQEYVWRRCAWFCKHKDG